MPIEFTPAELKKLSNLVQSEQTTLESLDMQQSPELQSILAKVEEERAARHIPLHAWEAAQKGWKV